MMGTLQNESSKTRIDATGTSTAIEAIEERFYPKCWSGSIVTAKGSRVRSTAMAGMCRSKARGWEIDTADHEGDAQGDRGVD